MTKEERAEGPFYGYSQGTPMPIFWDDTPPEQGRDRLPMRVHSVLPGHPVVVRFLGHVHGVWTHWIADPDPNARPRGRSRPCCGPACPYHTLPCIKKGYAAALLWLWHLEHQKQEWRLGVIEVTEAIDQLFAKDLRGHVWKLERKGKRVNSPLVATQLEAVPDFDLPPPFDVRAVLTRMWGWREHPGKAS